MLEYASILIFYTVQRPSSFLSSHFCGDWSF